MAPTRVRPEKLNNSNTPLTVLRDQVWHLKPLCPRPVAKARQSESEWVSMATSDLHRKDRRVGPACTAAPPCPVGGPGCVLGPHPGRAP